MCSTQSCQDDDESPAKKYRMTDERKSRAENPFRRKKEEDGYSCQEGDAASAVACIAAVLPPKGGLFDHELAVLPTAALILSTGTKETAPIRALCDTGSQINLLTERTAQRVLLVRSFCDFSVCGVGDRELKVKGVVVADVMDRHGNGIIQRVKFVIVPYITSPLPIDNIYTKIDDKLERTPLHLADEKFCETGPIEALLGAGLMSQLISPAIESVGDGLIAQSTLLGWIVFGVQPVMTSGTKGKGRSLAICKKRDIASSNEKLEAALKRLYESEEIPGAKLLSPTEQWCEEQYKETHRRDENGRYVVTLLIDPASGNLGDSKQIALRRFYMLESRLSKDPETREKYVKFMREYESLGHMVRADRMDLSGPHYFVPHFCIQPKNKGVEKFRVVFDGSCADILQAGPKLQEDLVYIILRFLLSRRKDAG